MFKSIVQCVTTCVNLRCFNYKYQHYFNTLSLNIANYNNIRCNISLYRFNQLTDFSTTSLGFVQSDTNLDNTKITNKENLSFYEDDIPVTTDENKTPDLFESLHFDEITGGNEENINKLKLLLLEVDVMRQDGMKVPKKMSTEEWKELFGLKTRSQQIKLLKFLWKNEIRSLADKINKEKKKMIRLEKLRLMNIEDASNDHIKYGFKGSTIFLRVYETTINLHLNNKLVQAMQFGQNIVLDCGYEGEMSPIENKLCAKQLALLFADNRKNSEPFNIHYTNVNRDGILFNKLKRIIPTVDDPHFPINIREEHYLDLFPKEKLVYLTPHCRTELLQFNHDDIYIVGALVDKQNSNPLSLAKAKSEGIRMAQLPLDRYLQWALGTKSLTLNQVVAILLDIRTTGDWNLALKNVPQRKIRKPGEPIQDTRKFYRRGTSLQSTFNLNY